jgi:hypothetical protein
MDRNRPKPSSNICQNSDLCDVYIFFMACECYFYRLEGYTGGES